MHNIQWNEREHLFISENSWNEILLSQSNANIEEDFINEMSSIHEFLIISSIYLFLKMYFGTVNVDWRPELSAVSHKYMPSIYFMPSVYEKQKMCVYQFFQSSHGPEAQPETEWPEMKSNFNSFRGMS